MATLNILDNLVATLLTQFLRISKIPAMATGINANRVVVEIDDTLYEALMAAVEDRSSNLRKATVAEVIRGLIADHLVPARISSGAQ